MLRCRVLDELREAIGQGRYREARALAGDPSLCDLAVLLEALSRERLLHAFVIAYGIAELPAPTDVARELLDLALGQLAAMLERSDEALLAHAVLQDHADAMFVARDVARLARELDPALAEQADERARRVAERVLALALDQAPLVFLARARALAQLGRGDEALACVREAASLDDRLALRMVEARLLGRRGRGDEQRALLEQLVERYPSADAPARALVELDAGTPAAARWYALALARRFDAALTCEYAELLTKLGRDDEAVTLLESSHALAERSGEADASEQLARALVTLHRGRGNASELARWTAVVEQRVAVRERGYAVMAIALMVTLLAMVLVALLIM